MALCSGGSYAEQVRNIRPARLSHRIAWSGDHMPLSEGALAQDLCTRLALCLAMPSMAQSRTPQVAVLWKQLLSACYTCSIGAHSVGLSSNNTVTCRETFSMYLFPSRS